jgi:Raf kinase inhibitor-like YbhB/YbcL family protein
MDGFPRHRLVVLCCLLLLVGCRSAQAPEGLATPGESSLVLRSDAFADGEAIPAQYTCDQADISPPLEWEGAPASTVSYALIMDDPDAPVGTWVHWVVYDLTRDVQILPEDVSDGPELAGGGVHGTNSWSSTGYGGPCPPSGTHRYFFKLYALDVVLGTGPGLTKNELLHEIEGHILAQTQLVGTYSRP